MRPLSARPEARSQVVPRRALISPPWTERSGAVSFGGEAVFFVQGALTEEDRRAWRQMVDRRNKVIRKERRAAVRGWLDQKLTGLFIVICGGFLLFAAAMKMDVFYIILALFLLVGGVVIMKAKFPVKKPPDPLPEECFPPPGPPDTPVGAVFFGDGCFVFWAASEKTRLGYQAITVAWEDGDRFYLLLENRLPLVLPKRGFIHRTPEDFRGFLEGRLGRPFDAMDPE